MKTVGSRVSGNFGLVQLSTVFDQPHNRAIDMRKPREDASNASNHNRVLRILLRKDNAKTEHVCLLYERYSFLA